MMKSNLQELQLRAAIALALILSGAMCQTAELSYGVRSAFAAGQAPFLQHLDGGSVKVGEPGRAGLGDELRLEVVNFLQRKTNQNAASQAGKLTLFLDDNSTVLANSANRCPKTKSRSGKCSTRNWAWRRRGAVN